MALNEWIEIFATAAGLLYIIFMIRENIICWPFGIAGSMLSIYLFVDTKLYSEAVLYSYYVAMGAWGWIRWSARNDAGDNPIVRFTLTANTAVVVVATAAGYALGTFFDVYTDAERPMLDAMTTAFSFAATYLEVRKVLETWVFWLVINAVSIWLYQDRALDIYATLTAVYTVLSVVGFVRWLRVYQRQDTDQGTAAVKKA